MTDSRTPEDAMTITLTVKEEAELWAEVASTNLRIVSQEPREILRETPRQLGKGYDRSIEVYPRLWLTIWNRECHDDVQFKVPEWDHPVQFSVLLTGIVTDSFGQVGGRYTLISGSGVQRQMIVQTHRLQQYIGIDIHMPVEVLRALFPTGEGILAPELCFLAKENDWQTLIYPETDPAIQRVAWEIVNCSLPEVSKRIFLLGKVMELIGLQLASVLRDRGSSESLPKLRPATIAQIHHAKDLLLMHLENPPSILELAQRVGVSDRTLRRGFQELFGTTVIDYLTTKRLERAEQLLRDTQLSVAEISNLVGYASSSHFATAFKRKFGITPTECVLGKKQKN